LGGHFWVRGDFCVAAGELTEEMINDYLEHHFESRVIIISEQKDRRAYRPVTGLSDRKASPPALAGGY